MDFLWLFVHLPVASFACVIFATSILLLVQCAGVKKKRNQTSARGDPSRNTTKQQAGPSGSGNDSEPEQQTPNVTRTTGTDTTSSTRNSDRSAHPNAGNGPPVAAQSKKELPTNTARPQRPSQEATKPSSAEKTKVPAAVPRPNTSKETLPVIKKPSKETAAIAAKSSTYAYGAEESTDLATPTWMAHGRTPLFKDGHLIPTKSSTKLFRPAKNTREGPVASV
ncbi:hypothetical protein AAVH_07736 [Aphelenchoides avenae]|nr:hypothetical protein AAVH_07736 [Aphelenchus avenae]